jgi:peptidoglycan hydrolase FlgJ
MLPLDSVGKVSQVQDSYLDPNSLNAVKAMGRDKDPQALKEVAKKFEAMFVQQMLKTMREANEAFGEGNYFDSQTTRFHRDMLDQQMVLNLTSGSGIGLADHFYKQMLQNYGAGMKPEADILTDNPDGLLSETVQYKNVDIKPSAAIEGRPAGEDELDNWVADFVRMSDNSDIRNLLTESESNGDIQQPINYAMVPALLNRAPSVTNRTAQKASISASQENFVMMLKPHAEKAAAELDISPDVLIAQVALETGWGKHVIHDQQGANSFNLFNIKAGSQWQGGKVNVPTLEYRDGIAANEKADFRKYTNYADSFSDYVRIIKGNPRYENALKAGADSGKYAEALQSAGYATDPDYAKKIKSLLKSDALKPLADIKASAQAVLSMASITNLRQIVE